MILTVDLNVEASATVATAKWYFRMCTCMAQVSRSCRKFHSAHRTWRVGLFGEMWTFMLNTRCSTRKAFCAQWTFFRLFSGVHTTMPIAKSKFGLVQQSDAVKFQDKSTYLWYTALNRNVFGQNEHWINCRFDWAYSREFWLAKAGPKISAILLSCGSALIGSKIPTK